MRISRWNSCRAWTTVLLALVAVALPLGSPGVAQHGGRPVVVLIPDVFPQVTFAGAPQGEARLMIVREPGKTDIIVLNPAHATPDAMGAALVLLRRHRTMFPDPARPTSVQVTEFPPLSNRRSHAAFSALLRRLQAQPHAPAARFGRGRQIQLDPDSVDQ